MSRAPRVGTEKTVALERRSIGVSEGYDVWAASYDDYGNPLVLVEEGPVHSLLGDVRGRHVLDAACGTGRHTRWLCDQGARVVGVDGSSGMLDVARTKCPEADLRLGSVLELPVESASFDVVVNALMAEHVADLNALVAELARALRPGGLLVLSVFHPAMIAKGVLTHFEHAASATEYELATFAHTAADYHSAFVRAGIRITDTLDLECDAALLERMPWMTKHAGTPLALVMAGTKLDEAPLF